MTNKTIEIKTKIRGVSRDDPKSGRSRQEIIRKHVKAGTRLVARLEPDNPVNRNAIALWFESFHLGYLSDELSDELADRMRGGTKVWVTVLGVTGGEEGMETLGVNIVLRYEDDGTTVNVYSEKAAEGGGNRRRNVIIGVVVVLILCLCLCLALVLVSSAS